MRIAFHTLGCKVNHYETEAIREAFVSRGAEAVDEDKPADVYIINTCTVTNIADRKSRQFIRRARRLNPEALIVVTGCYAQTSPDEIAALPEVDLVVGNGQKSMICGMVLERMCRGSFRDRDTGDADRTGAEEPSASKIFVLDRSELTEYEDMGLVCSSEPGMTRAYVKIQEGCDRFCSYCLIPYARGTVRSRDQEEIVAEVEMLVSSGVREVVLTGINTALYGTEEGFRYPLTDAEGRALPGLEHIAAAAAGECERGCVNTDPDEISPQIYGAEDGAAPVNREGALNVEGAVKPWDADESIPSAPPHAAAMCSDGKDLISPLEALLARLDAVMPDKEFRIRLSSLEPTVVDRDNVEKIIRYRRLCRHLHLSVQNGSDNVLKRMNRHYTREEYLDIVRAIRDYDPLYGITTDIIVGFPGETAEDMEQTLDVVREAGFGKVHVFRYSPRRGTAGAGMKNAVPESVKSARSDELEAAAALEAQAFMESNLGTEQTVLAEEEQDGYMTGYTDNYIRTYIEAGSGGENRPEPGDFCRVILTELFRDGVKATLTDLTAALDGEGMNR